MKKLKKLFFSTILILIIAFSISCEDYLMNDESSTITEENLFSNIDFAEKAVLNIYGKYSTTLAWIYNLSSCLYADTDILFSRQNNATTQAGHYINPETNRYNEQNWISLYKAIEAANIVIDGLPISDLWTGSDSIKARQLYGEAVVMRAFTYSHLLFLHGDIPFYVNAAQGDSEFYPPKTDRDSIYEFLIQDLKDVEDYIPWMDQTRTIERVNKGFAKGLRGKMALHYAGYSLRNKTFETRRGRHWEEYLQIARQEFEELMQSGMHALNPSFKQLIKDMHTNTYDMMYKEWMFCMPAGRATGEGRWGSQTLGLYIRSIGSKKYGNHNAGGRWQTSPAYFYSFDKEDPRRMITAAPYNRFSTDPSQPLVPQQNHCFFWGLSKWRSDWIEPSLAGQPSVFLGIDIPALRYADIVLMFAETENEISGPTAKAKEALSSIRRRAFPEELWPEKVNHYVDSVAASKESFFNAIVDERAWEFGGEFIRKPDLVRWNLFGPKVREWKENFKHLIDDDDPKYANVPRYVYWKYPDDGSDGIEFLNLDYRLPDDTEIEGYNKIAWISLMSDTQKNQWKGTYLPTVAQGYDETKNNHLYPIALTHISDSKGAWENDNIP